MGSLFGGGETPQARDYFKDLEIPDIRFQEIQLEQLVQQGVITPEEAKTIMLEDSQMKGISLDPKLKQAQMNALASLSDISESGGMTLMDRANMEQVASEENARARGQREAILQNAQSRGLGGSGLELMSQLQNQQDSATRASQRDMNITAQAQARALEALMNQGQLAGQIGAQDFGQQAQIAGAQDAISRFNAQNSQNQINQNVQARNQAQAANLAARQEVSNANAGLRNQQQQYNKGLLQQQYQNELSKRGGQAGISQANQAAAGQNSANEANARNNLISTGASIIGTIYGGPAGGAAAGAGAKALLDEDQKNKR